ncbi:MAG TPA: type II toxin-antitoxin system VapC family toxin [Actinomycetota bacterium]|nr:type II toxin-antitoxin system VapC family toxin [Actinomycetota bacterium]
MRLVLDASALVQLVADEEESDALREFFAGDDELHVPAICDAEVVSGLARHVRTGSTSADAARDALVDYISLPLTRHMHVSLIARTYELTANFAASDASYVALAEALDASLVTLDGALGRAVRRHTSVEVLP